MKRLFLLLFLFAWLNAHSQRFNFVNYSLEEGLPQSQVTAICQDQFGYLWIGTETGLSRFDGLEFENFSTDEGLPDNEINSIYIDASGEIWVATPKGVAQFNIDRFKPYPFSKSLQLEYRVNDMCEMRNQIYLGTDEGLLLFERDTFRLLTPQENASPLRAILNMGDSVLICGSKTGLFTYHNGNMVSFGKGEFDSINISDLYLRQNELLISSYGEGLLRYEFESGKITTHTVPGNRIRSIYANAESILCATKNGAIEIADKTYHYNLQNGLSFESIRCVYIDRENNLWLGSDGKGLMKLTSKSVTYFKKEDGLSSDAVMSISQDKAGFYYFGTYDAGVTKWLNASDSSPVEVYNDQLKNTTIWITALEKNNRCWVGTSNGVDLIENGSIVNSNPVANEILFKTRTLLFTDDSLLLGGGSGGIFSFDGIQVVQHFQDQDLDVNKIVQIGKSIYIATTTGLFISDAKLSSVKLINLPENNVKTLTTDNNGNLWIGSNSSGIFVQLTNGKVVPFELDKSDSKSKTILGIIADSKGNIWVSTLNGVYEIEFDANTDEKYTIRHYGRPEGLITLECNQNALFEDAQNHIWVGTSEGLVRINPALNHVLFEFKKPELVITGVRLFMENFNYESYDVELNSTTGVPTSIILPYNKNHLTFDFIGINLKDPEGVRYEYRLLGAEDFWSPLTTNSYATYSFISHGEYDFEVRAINASGKWSEIQRMHIIILPPFWRTWWFIILVIIACVGIILLIFQIRIRAIKQKQENERLGFKNRLLFLEQQSLNASMNRHFIFNSLNSIQYFINSSNKLAANKYLTSFAKLIRKNLDSSQANNFIVTLKEEMERIELYLSLERMRFDGKFEYIIDLSDDIDTDGIEIPSMILQPFVENSIIHGVLPLERKGTITLKVYLEFGFLVFEVIDDGVGIDSSLELKKNRKSEPSHDSMGMEITNRRIDLIRKLTGENLMIIGPFQINNSSGQSLGTKVIIKINAENQGNS